jgi:hypothetical protein
MSSNALVGTFTFVGGRRLPLTLKRGQSHWDRALVDRPSNTRLHPAAAVRDLAGLRNSWARRG